MILKSVSYADGRLQSHNVDLRSAVGLSCDVGTAEEKQQLKDIVGSSDVAILALESVHCGATIASVVVVDLTIAALLRIWVHWETRVGSWIAGRRITGVQWISHLDLLCQSHQTIVVNED